MCIRDSDSAVRALHKAVSLGADRSIHLSDPAVAGSDVAATGYALAKTLQRESPDLVLLGQQSDDGECYTIGAVVAEHLGMPSLTQVIKMDVESDALRCERQAEYGYDTCLLYTSRRDTRSPRPCSARARTWCCSASSPTTASATRSAPSWPSIWGCRR